MGIEAETWSLWYARSIGYLDVEYYFSMYLDGRAKKKSALLATADGLVFHGISIGASEQAVGELVFNTAMSGYQEALSDPSYTEQVLVFTYPHIGNVGINSEDWESDRFHVAATVLREPSPVIAGHRGERDSVLPILGRPHWGQLCGHQ